MSNEQQRPDNHRGVRTRREALRWLGGGAALTLLSACQSSPAAPAQSAPNPLVKPKPTGAAPDLTAVLANAEVAVGYNRLAIGLIGARNQSIGADAGQVHVELFKVDATSGKAEKRADADAVYRTVEQAPRGVWVIYPTLTESGPWGAQVTLTPPNAPPLQARMTMNVLPKFSAPGYGEAAPRSKTVTAQDVGGDLSRICTNSPPCPMHTQSVDAALAAGDKPSVITFATPAFCTSATCAPELNAIVKLHDAYEERVSFVHVEIYQYPFEQQQPVKAVQEWRLPSEPWVFVTDRSGAVRGRFEGAAPADEVEESLKGVL